MAHSEEELRIILSESYKNGEINQSEFKYVNKIFEFDNRIAKEIMVPRTEIVSLSKDETLENFLAIIKEEKFTRYPVIDGDKDHIIGMVNMKELLTDILDYQDLKIKTLETYIRPIIKVIDRSLFIICLLKMQKERIHMAILWMNMAVHLALLQLKILLKKLSEKFVMSLIQMKYQMIRKIEDDHFIIDSKVLVSEVNDLLGLEINDEDVDTIGGWILTENYEAKQGDIIRFELFHSK